jgi:CheY-like chemotaxis protein
MDGITATKKIREYEKKNNLTASKIIAVTANALDGDEERFLSIGMDDYIPKPVDIEKLKKALKQD